MSVSDASARPAVNRPRVCWRDIRVISATDPFGSGFKYRVAISFWKSFNQVWSNASLFNGDL